MWEDITIALACLGFVAALGLIVAELRGVLAGANSDHDADAHVEDIARQSVRAGVVGTALRHPPEAA